MDTREAIADAYTGISQGLKSSQKGTLLINYAQQIFSFLEISVQEMDKSETYCKAMIGLLGYTQV
jgi:importin subunit beta-1